MKISKLILIFISIFIFIYSGPVVGAAACTACCAAVHAPEAAFMPFYLGMVGKCVTSCLASWFLECPHHQLILGIFHV